MNCFSLSCFNVPHCGPVAQSFFDFCYCDTFEDYRPILCTVSLDLHLFHVSLLSGSSCTYCQEYHRDDAVFSLPAIGWHRVSFFHFDHLDEMMSAMLLHCKVILFPFVTNNCCGNILWNYVSFPFVIKFSAYSFINLYLEYLCFPFNLMGCNNPLPSLFILMIKLS